MSDIIEDYQRWIGNVERRVMKSAEQKSKKAFRGTQLRWIFESYE